THPTGIRTDITEDNSSRLHLTGNWPRFFLPFVVSGSVDASHFISATIISIAAICAVMPAGKQLTIAAVQFTKLFAIGIRIFFISILGVMAVPSRHINAKLHVLLVRRFHKLLYHI